MFADSPLTSINIHKAYLEYPIVKSAVDSNGRLSKQLMSYLLDDTKPQPIKLAIINAIGWNHKNKNSRSYRNQIIKTKNYTSEFGDKYTAFLWNATAEELLFYSYMKALENYWQPLMVFEYLNRAIEKDPKNLNIRLIYELSKSQVLYEINEKGLAQKNINKVLEQFKNNKSRSNLNQNSLLYCYDFFKLGKQ
ncbi:hypothetical protein [Psychroflexus salis]|uniref:Uncharacterized protein n=1 Tax=Psychroflexus salis TaxID=1526574 RepID=A0A916ZQG5_9FLAO|nr:hypothetical protein [Psychroflexus salis]GGE09157.1 hypothetical protein GCM10010831_08400 [Psychroflexus salis]